MSAFETFRTLKKPPRQAKPWRLAAALAVLFFLPLVRAQDSQPAETPAAISTTAPSSAPAQSHRAAIITIRDEINDVTLASMVRRVEEAREEGVDIIIFEMDTPGGLVSSALEICTYIKNMTDMKTIAWVRPAAYSAGAMISLSCDEVVMASASKMGDCAPIIVSPTDGLQSLGETERAKAESPILKEFVDSAHRRGYDRLLCEAMVRTGNEVWWMENTKTHERMFVLKDEKEKLLAEEDSPWQPIKTMTDPVSGNEIAVRQPVVEERDLLTLTQTEAVAFGFAKAIISTETELKSHYDIAGSPLRAEPNWSEGVADFLSSPIVRTVLMILIALGAYSEFHAPGTFVGGGVALVALIIFLGAPYITGLADVWEILLVGIGIILLLVEIFIIPGFGVAGILGILFIFIGLIATFVPAEPGPVIIPRMPGSWLGLKTGLRVVFGGLLLSLAGMWLLNRYLPSMPGTRGLFLQPPQPATATNSHATASATHEPAPKQDTPEAGPSIRPGDTGTTLTRLRPAGKANINGHRTDVIAQGQMIDEGRPVQVVDVLGSRIVVRESERA